MSGPIARFLQMWGWWWCRPAWWRETLPTAVTSTVRVFVPSLPSSSSQCTSFIDLYLRVCQNNLKGNSLRYTIHSRTSGRVGNIRVESYEISILLEISCLTLARQSDVIGCDRLKALMTQAFELKWDNRFESNFLGSNTRISKTRPILRIFPTFPESISKNIYICGMMLW